MTLIKGHITATTMFQHFVKQVSEVHEMLHFNIVSFSRFTV